jgi:hypothetical protein
MGLTKRRVARGLEPTGPTSERGEERVPSVESVPRSPPSSPQTARSGRNESTVAADEATAWLRGEGDLLRAATGRPVTVAVQLGVLAHGSAERLGALGRCSRRGSVRRAWGTDMADLAGAVAQCGQSAEALGRFQAEFLVPLELDVLAGRRTFASRGELAAYVRDRLPLAEDR